MFTNFVTFTHAEGQILPPNEIISSHRLEEPAVHVSVACCVTMNRNVLDLTTELQQRMMRIVNLPTLPETRTHQRQEIGHYILTWKR